MDADGRDGTFADDNPLISIVLPTHNGSRYLPAAIDSCLNQTYRNWELVIVDDASTDCTPQVIAEYMARDRRIRAVRNEANRKLPGSLNVGFSHAGGGLFTWTSDDNCYRPEALREMLRFLKSNPATDVVYASYSLIDNDGAPLRGMESGPRAGPPHELPCRNCVGACFLYRRAVHERLGGYAEDLFLVEDYDFWLRASILFRLAWLEKDLYLYRWHEHSLTATVPLRVRAARETALSRNLPRMAWVPAAVRARTYQGMVVTAMERQDRRAAWRHLLKAVTSDPRVTMPWALRSLPYLTLPVPQYRLIPEQEDWQWIHRMHLARHELSERVPPGKSFILVDDTQLGNDFLPGRRAIPFLEKDGQFWGPPPDDETGIRELERLRQSGAGFIVFGWPAFWWLEHYVGLAQHLRDRFPRLLQNERLVAFDLRSPRGGWTA
jgi:glycosyltransferase involved in cell wall biosynthesis